MQLPSDHCASSNSDADMFLQIQEMSVHLNSYTGSLNPISPSAQLSLCSIHGSNHKLLGAITFVLCSTPPGPFGWVVSSSGVLI